MVQRSLVVCLVSCMLVVILVCSCDVIRYALYLFHSFVYVRCHFPFHFVVPIPLAYSFIVSSVTPHLIIHHKIFDGPSVTASSSCLYLMTLLCDSVFLYLNHSMAVYCV